MVRGRGLVGAVVAFLCVLLFSSPVGAQEKKVAVTVNGNKVSFGVAPYIDENSRTMVPLRFIAESLGCYVHWDPGEKRVTITRGGLVASLVLGQKSVTVNGKAVPMDTRAVEVGGRTMVPVRSIAEIFGARVSWDPGTWTVHIITSPEPAGAWVEVTGRVVNIRSGPGLDKNPIGQVEFGTRLRVLEYGTGWVKVVTPWGEEGWISSQYVKRVDGAPEPPSDIPPGDIKGVIVTANGVRIRSGPGTDYQIIGQVNAGDYLEVVGKAGDWYRVNYQGRTGYIAGWLTAPRLASRSGEEERDKFAGEVEWVAQDIPDEELPVLKRIQVSKFTTRAELRIELTGDASHRSFRLDNPHRLVIDLSPAWFPVLREEAVDVSHFLVGRLRVAQFAPDTVRIVLDLTGPAVLQEKSSGAEALVFVVTAPSLQGKRVVLDPGHGTLQPGGWLDPGAVGPSGLKEVDVVMDIARKVGSLLAEEGAEVFFTRDGSTSLSIYERGTFPSRVGADVFVSIHANASVKSTVSGTSAYYYSGNGGTRWESLALARAVQNAAVKAGGRLDLGVTEANFAVLRDCPVPACLIEVAFISNPEEEKLLADPAFRSRIAMGIFEGIKAYLTSK